MEANKKKQNQDVYDEEYFLKKKNEGLDLNGKVESAVSPSFVQTLPVVNRENTDYILKPDPLMTEEEKQKAVDTIVRTLRPIADAIGVPLDNLAYGFLSRAEGIGDALANLTALFGNDEYKRKIQDFVAEDSTSSTWLRESGQLPKAPFGSNMLQGVLQSIGGMGLDAVANLAAPGAGLASLGIGAAGKATEEAYKDGADYGRGTLYGIAQGATEVATEMMFDSPINKIYNSGFLRPVASTFGGKVVKGAAGEAIEEWASELANPLEKAIYKGKDALKEYGEGDYWKGVGLAGASGALTAGIVGTATGSYSHANMASEFINDAQTEITKRANQEANGKLDAKKEAASNKKIQSYLQAAEKNLTNMSKAKRAGFFAKNKGATAIFTEDGKIRPEFARKTWGGQSAAETANGAQAQNAGLSEGKKRYVSVNARYDGERATNAVKALQDALNEQGKGETAEIYSGELSSEQEETYAVAKRIVNNLNQTTGDDMALIVVGGENDFNALNEKNGNAILISEKTLSKTHGAVDALAKILFEEATHSTQSRNAVGQYMSTWYVNLVHELATNHSATMEAITARLLADGNGYGFTQEMLEWLESKLDSKESLTEKEQELLDEIGAQTVGEILGGNKEIVEKYASNKNAAEKILGVFGKIKKALSRATNKTAKAERARVERVEGMLLTALAEKGYTYRDGKVISVREPEEKEGEDVRFAIKTVNGIGKVAYIDEDLIQRKPGQSYTDAVKEYFDTYLSGMEIPVESSGDSVTIQQKKKFFDKASQPKKQAVQILDDIISIGENKVHKENFETDLQGNKKKHTGLSASRGWDYYDTNFEIGDRIFSARVIVRKSGDGIDYFYDLDNIQNRYTTRRTGTESRTTVRDGVPTDNSVPQTSENVNPKREKISSISQIEQKYKDETKYLLLNEGKDTIKISNMVVKEEYRGKGIGQQILSDVISYADSVGKTITLTPTQEFDTYERLKNWYKKNGFVENKGRNADLRISDTMYRAPVSAADQQNIRFSKTDSLGNALTDAQQRYFENSKVRDENGNLMVVYHGSPSVFTKFSADYLGMHGSSEGQGFYFTDSKNMAEGYKKSGGQLLSGYLNIQNPLSDETVTLKRSEVRKLIKALDPTGDDLILNYDPRGGMDYPSAAWYDRSLNATLETVMSGNNSDSEILAELANAMGDHGKVLETVSGVLGYDGYIVSEKYDGANVYVSFKSNQFKNLDNFAPTANDDIRFSRGATPTEEDNRYLAAVQNGDTEAAQKMVDEAAKRAGYTEKLYHGTKAFGFTVFDPKMSDDKLSLFATRNEEIARSYSGKDEVRRIASRIDLSDVDKYSEKEMIAKLNDFAESYDDEKNTYSRIDQEEYDYLRRTVKSDLYQLEMDVSEKVEELQKKRESGNITSQELDGYDRLTRYGLLDSIEKKDYSNISTQLYLLLNQTDIFSDQTESLSELEKNIRLVRMLNDMTEGTNKMANPVILREELGGYSLDFLTDTEAREELKRLMGKGNYALYGNPGRQLTIDAKGQNWNNINGWTKAIAPTLENTYVQKDDGTYYLVKKGTDDLVTNGTLEDNGFVSKMSERQIHVFLVAKVSGILKMHEDTQRSTRDIAKWANNLGYNSVLIKNVNDFGGNGKHTDIGDIEIYFDSNRLKSADPVTYDDDGNVIPLSERFNEQNEDIRFSRGLNARVAANNTGERVFSKKVAKAAIETIMESNLVFGDEYSTMRGTIRGKGRIIDELFYKLNRTQNKDYQRAVANSIADQIIDSTVLEETYSALPGSDAESIDRAKQIVEMMSEYRHRIKFDNIKGDVKYTKDDKWQIYALQWSAKQGATNAISADQLADAFDEIGIKIDAENEAEIFLQAMDQYEQARKTINEAVKKTTLTEYGSKDELAKLKKTISDEIMQVFENGGERSKFSKMVSRYTDQIKFMREMWKVSKKVLDIKLEGKRFASDTRSIQVNAALKLLNGMTRGSDLIPNRAREVCRNLAEWYSKENTLFADGLLYNEQLRDMMQAIGDSDGALTADEMTDLTHILDFMANFAKTYKRVFKAGRYVDADKIVKADIDIARRANKDYVRNPAIRAMLKVHETYGMFTGDPAMVARMADGHRNGFFTQLIEEMREGQLQMEAVRYELQTEISEFLKDHKGYKPENRMVKVRGVEMPADFAISLFLTTKRQQSWAGFVESGYRLFLKEGEKSASSLGDSIVPLGENGKYTEEQLKSLVEEFRSDIDKELTDIDHELISVVEKVLKRAGQLKMERDIQRMGFTNATEDYYYPLLRASIAQNFDADLATGKRGYFDTVSNLSMNKDIVKGANSELGIQSVFQVLSRHIDQTAMYYGLSNLVDNFNVLSNFNLSDNVGKPETMARTANESVLGKKTMQYFRKLLKDLEGVYYADPSEKGANRIIDKLRSNAAVAAIAANPKSLANQFASLFAGTAILSPRDLAKGITLTKVDVDKYSEVARLRNANLEATRAETITDKVGKVGEILMKPTSWGDRFVVQIEFGACQAYVERTQGLAIGTEENLVAAGKLLNRVIRETQQGASPTERSAMARSSNPIYKGLAMFRNDAVKQIGRVIDGFGELYAIKEDLRTETEAAKIEELKGRQKTARLKTAKAVGALVGSSIYQALIALLFAKFLNRLKNKDKEEIARDVIVDSVAELFTGLPIISQAIEFLTGGYGVEDFTIASFNSLLESMDDISKLLDGNATEREVKNAIRKAVFSGGQLLGIPTRNVFNYFYGTVNTINDYAGYKVHGLLYSDNYKSELYKALNDGDNDRAQLLGSLLVDSSYGGYSKATKDAIKPLVAAGYSVLPRTVGDSITYDGQEYKLTSRQKARFQKVYGQASAAVQKVVALQSYRKLSDEVKAKTIKRIYDMYYNLAIDDLLGTDTEDKTVLFSYAIDPDKLALIIAQAQSLQADTDKSGKPIAGSKKQKVVDYVNGLKLSAAQKYMIMGYLGYKNAKGEAQVRSYVNNLKLSKKEKEMLMEYSGY